MKLGNIVLILGFVVLILAGGYRLGYFSKEVYIILDVLSGVLFIAGVILRQSKRSKQIKMSKN
ncbi:hypothetical protein ACFVRR_06790 [Gottfriedia sp. NPDC057948]|uniref:hypothetical protein n=1 Tax=Gottfriedia sp. NPDC057948 TaxID=3346287 RepID=UPI0036DD9D3B